MKPPCPPKTPKKFNVAKDPIEVFCRIRPLTDQDQQVCVRIKDEKTVILVPPEIHHNRNGRLTKEVHKYSFKHVFDDTASQKDLFDHVCLPLVRAALQGNNGLLFTYGISSSGKTYTMEGTPQDGGLLPRSLDVIFNSIKNVQARKYIFKPDKANGFEVQSTVDALVDQQKELEEKYKRKPKNKKERMGNRLPDSTSIREISHIMRFSVFISYVEIYNNYIYDLLEENPKSSKTLREDAKNNVYVCGAQEKIVRTVDEALDLFYKGQDKRKRACTALNVESSRSHSVFTIRIVQAPFDPHGTDVLQDKEKVIVSQLSLVDLAGSERSSRTENAGHKLKEAGNINSSLMTLRKCIESLRKSQTLGITKMVPYRESKLTNLFKTFFEGEGKLRMIVCINPQADNYEETVHVLQFAETTQEVEIPRPTPVFTPTIPVPVSDCAVVYNLGPELPQVNMNIFDEESKLTNLIDCLAARNSRRKILIADLELRQEKFRESLNAVIKDNFQLMQENEILQMDLGATKQQVRNLEQKLYSVENSFDDVQRQAVEFRRKAENASEVIWEKDRVLAEKDLEIERIKVKMQRIEVKRQEEKASLKRHMEKLMDKKLAEEKKRKMLLKLREIINANEWDKCCSDTNLPRAYIPSKTFSNACISSTESEASGPITRRKRPCADIENLNAETQVKTIAGMHDSDDDVMAHDSHILISRQAAKSTRNVSTYKENRVLVSTPNLRGIVVANPRHRRSASVNNAWVEHKPIGNLKLNTVLQPAIKKKKSVSKLKVKDVTNSEKYILQHQEQDSQGEIETQLFKGDIIPSAGGGAQVIFNDIEKLSQVSPPLAYNLRKRTGNSLPLREIEDKCTVSVECHGYHQRF